MKRSSLVLALGAALLATMIVVSGMAWHGKLAIPPIYDDVSYLLRGFNIYEAFYRSWSAWDLVVSWPALPKHAPVADLQAFFGFLLFGDWLPGTYLLAAVYLALFMWLVLRLFEGQPLYLRMAVCLLVLTTPFVLYVVTYLKSDYTAGLFFAAATLCLLGAVRLRSERSLVGWGALTCAAAILAKPTGFHIPVILSGVLFLGFVCRWVADDDPGGRAWRNLRPFLLICALGAMVVFVFMLGGFRHVLDYIIWQMNPGSGYYAESRSLLERLPERLPLDASMRRVWGVAFWWALALGVVANGWLFARQAWSELLRSACFATVVLVTWIATLLTPFANLSFAALFFFATLAYALYLLGLVARGPARERAGLLATAVVVSTLLGFHPRSQVPRNHDWRTIAVLNETARQLVADINRWEVYSVATSGLSNGPLNDHMLELQARLERLPGKWSRPIVWRQVTASMTPQAVAILLDQADLYIGLDGQAHGQLTYPWMYEYPYQLPLQQVAANPGFVELARYPVQGAHYRVYVRSSLVGSAP